MVIWIIWIYGLRFLKSVATVQIALEREITSVLF